MINNNDKIKELISSYIDGCNTEEEKKQVEDLIINSKEWQEYYKEIKKLSVTLKDWPDEGVSPDLASKIQNSLLKDKLREGHTMDKKTSFIFGGGFVVTLCLCLLIGTFYIKHHSTEGRLKYAADDIGDQFSSGNTNKIRVMTKTGSEGQYEPYYLETDYTVASRKDADGYDLKSEYSKVTDAKEVDRRQPAEYEVAKKSMKKNGGVGGKYDRPLQVSARGEVSQRSDVGIQYGFPGGSGSISAATPDPVISESNQQLAYNVKAKEEFKKPTRGAGGFQQSSYDTRLGLIKGLGSAPQAQQVAKQQDKIRAKDGFLSGVTQSTLVDEEVTTQYMNSDIMDVRQEFWGGGTQQSLGKEQAGRLDRRIAGDQIAYNQPAASTIPQKRRSQFSSSLEQGNREYSRERIALSEKRAYDEGHRYEPYSRDERYFGDDRSNLIYERPEYDDDTDYPYRRRPDRHKPDTEEYDPVYENPFQEVRYAPLSTFSIDTDTASYSNVRRFLNNNQLPPADAVRIEEMINYFDYNYPRATGGKPFSVTTNAAHCPWNRNHYLVMVGLQGAVPSERKIPPSNLVFLIDVSGSMNSGNKLPLLKRSLRLMVEQLRPDQRVAIVAYAGSARLILDSTPGSNKSRILAAIDRLSAGGSTAGEAGLKLAYRVARDNYIRKGNNRVILASDGDFNVGMSSDYELVRLIEQRRKDGIFLSILGFGTGNLKDAKMEKIADNGNGNYHYIDSIDEGKKVLVDELGSTLFTIAKDVKIQVEFNPRQVHAYRLIGYENRLLAKQDFNNDRVDAGEIGAGHTVTALYEIVPAHMRDYPHQQFKGEIDRLKYQKRPIIGNPDIMIVKLRYKNPKANRSKLIKKVVRSKNVLSQPNDDLAFAAAVAEFGMLLRNSRYKGQATYDHIIRQVYQSLGHDTGGHRSEFIRMVEKAKQLDYRHHGYHEPERYPRPEPYPYDDRYNDYRQPPMQFK